MDDSFTIKIWDGLITIWHGFFWIVYLNFWFLRLCILNLDFLDCVFEFWFVDLALYLSTNRNRCVDNNHSKGRNECKMQLLWEPSTVASNALELWWLLWWWWWCKWRWRCFDDDDEPAMHNKHHGVYEDEWENLNNWKIRLFGRKKLTAKVMLEAVRFPIAHLRGGSGAPGRCEKF